MTTVKQLADELSDALVCDKRPDGTDYLKLRDGSPQWMQEAIREAHDHAHILPDDYRYSMVNEAADILSESEDEDDEHTRLDEYEAPVYTYELCAWLASNVYRTCYCNDAMAEYGGDIKDITQAIALGYIAEFRETFQQLKAALSERAAELADA